MAVDTSRLHYKGASGVNRGWRRSRLGGGSGFHFYAWWAPAGAAPLQRSPGFDDNPEAVFLRDIRHHDDHTPLSSGDAASDYLPMNVADLRGGEYAPAPWTQQQARFARSRGTARVLKGHPGSGKTTALLNAADESHAARVLYLTFSRDLAALARDYFDRFCSDSRTFIVRTFPDWVREIAGERERGMDPEEARARFRRDLANQHRALGPWSNHPEALYDEMHAHLVGAAMPEKSGRFTAAHHLRLPDDAYRSQRARYLGQQGADAVLEVARRLDRLESAPLADRYFPDLALAWRAARNLRTGANPAVYDCIAVDEIQDLTPLETFTVLALAHLANSKNRASTLLLAGDEAQTVRATDFEWAWLNDMLHDSLGAPQEFKLQVNLRSPRRIADLVNRAWDLYDYLHKQDRPSGSGYAEIDDDSPDEVLYGAIRNDELPGLLAEFTAREGMAVIALDQTGIPKEALASVLSPADAKGLDFHSVCILNGGSVLRGIAAPGLPAAAASLSTRLAIDQLRVALSRPTGQLIWIDVAPDAATIRETGEFLRPRGEAALAPVTLEAIRASFDEEELDVEERIQRCRQDARQFVDVKPDLAWSRAHQAVAMLGHSGDSMAVIDRGVREETQLTLSEICFKLAVRGKKLSAELGRPDLYVHAAEAAFGALKFSLASALRAIGGVERTAAAERLNSIASAIQAITDARDQLPSWLIVELAPRAEAWLAELDRHMEAGENAVTASHLLPPFFDALKMSDAAARRERLEQRAVRILMKGRKYVQALSVLDRLPETEANRKLVAECCEESGQFAKAASKYAELGEKEKAFRCFRSAADFNSALALVREMDTHPARESLEWLAELGGLLTRRPENFNRVMTTPEKKLLEEMLERGLGVQRKKPAARKAPAKKAPATKKAKAPDPKKPAASRRGPAGPGPAKA
jgi:tetratricopeptide (TPR) repeat protein